MTWVPKNRSAEDGSGKSEDEEENANNNSATNNSSVDVNNMSMGLSDYSNLYGNMPDGGKYLNTKSLKN